jgi:hypothetical protein
MLPITPTILHIQDKIKRASQRSMLSGVLAKQKVHDLGVAEMARQKRKESGGKVVQKYGEIYENQARRDIEADEEDENKVVNMWNQWTLRETRANLWSTEPEVWPY